MINRVQLFFFIFLLTICFISPLASGNYDYQILYGDRNDPVLKIAFFAEGYAQNEKSRYEEDVKKIVDTFFTISPFKEYRNFFTVFMVWTPSKKSGIPEKTPSDSTKFGGYYTSGRYLSLRYFDSLSAILSDTVMFGTDGIKLFKDIPVVVYNVDFFSGISDGPVVTYISRTAGGRALAHEAGHVLGGLGDEYDTEYIQNVQKAANVTQKTELESIPWKYWIESSTLIPTPETEEYASVVGLFEGANYHPTGWFRPKLRCLMNSYKDSFCEVCRECIVGKIISKAAVYHFVTIKGTDTLPQTGTWVQTSKPGVLGANLKYSMIRNFTPPPSKTTSHTFSVDYVQCEKLSHQWFFNGKLVSNNDNELDVSSFNESGIVEFLIRDTSGYVRNPDILAMMSESVKWMYLQPLNIINSNLCPNMRIRQILPGIFSIPEKSGIQQLSVYSLNGKLLETYKIKNTDETTIVRLRNRMRGIFILVADNKKAYYTDILPY